MKVLLTGADGQLAFALHERLRAQHEVVARSRPDLDVTSETAVQDAVRAVRPQVIINGAAYNNVDAAEDDPLEALAVNGFAVRSLAEAAEEVDAILVHYSTDFVFDGTARTPYPETATPNPQSVYATSKLLGEWFAARCAKHYVLRVESLFGGGLQTRLDGRTPGSSLDRIADALLEGREVRAFHDRVVSPSFVPDVADVTTRLLEHAAPFGLYHCVGEGYATWVDVAKELAAQLRTEARIVPVSMTAMELKAERPSFCALSNTRLRSMGIVPPRWQNAVARFATARREIPQVQIAGGG
jgi:dTDP-4-dehydrorhamnose reductase